MVLQLAQLGSKSETFFYTIICPFYVGFLSTTAATAINLCSSCLHFFIVALALFYKLHLVSERNTQKLFYELFPEASKWPFRE